MKREREEGTCMTPPQAPEMNAESGQANPVPATERGRINREEQERERENSNSKTLILKDSRVRSIWTYLTASPCYSANTNRACHRQTDRDRQTDRQTDTETERQRQTCMTPPPGPGCECRKWSGKPSILPSQSVVTISSSVQAGLVAWNNMSLLTHRIRIIVMVIVSSSVQVGLVA